MNQDHRPYQGRKLSKKEQRIYRQQAKKRAAARAAAMPAPASTERRDPVTGQPVNARTPNAGSGKTPIKNHQGTKKVGQPGKAPRVRKLESEKPTKKKPKKVSKKPAPLPELHTLADAVNADQTPGFLEEFTAGFEGRKANAAVVVGAIIFLSGLVYAIVQGTPLLTSGFDFLAIAAGSILSLAGAYLVARGFIGATNILKFVTLGVTLTASLGLVVGALANPVVVDDQVLLENSKEAKSARFAEEIYEDLRTLAEYDDLLAASLADARANVSLYPAAEKEIIELNSKYAEYTVEDLPDPAFAPVVDNMKNASFWAAQAISSKEKLIEAEDARAQSDLQTQRASFVELWVQAGSGLETISTDLGIPFTQLERGPRE